MNQIAKVKAADEVVRRRMEKLLKWSAGQLNECEYQQGLTWLNVVFGLADGPSERVTTVRRKLEGSAGFWAWWKNQWRRLDAELSPNLKVSLVAGEWMLGMYRPAVGPTFYTPDTWKVAYQNLHALEMARLRPDDATLARILKGV